MAMVIALFMFICGNSAKAVIYSVETYKASIQRGRFLSDIRLNYNNKITLLDWFREHLNPTVWKNIKQRLSARTEEPREIIAWEYWINYKDVDEVLRELTLAFEVSHLYKEIVSNLANMQKAYAEIRADQRLEDDLEYIK